MPGAVDQNSPTLDFWCIKSWKCSFGGKKLFFKELELRFCEQLLKLSFWCFINVLSQTSLTPHDEADPCSVFNCSDSFPLIICVSFLSKKKITIFSSLLSWIFFSFLLPSKRPPLPCISSTQIFGVLIHCRVLFQNTCPSWQDLVLIQSQVTPWLLWPVRIWV